MQSLKESEQGLECQVLAQYEEDGHLVECVSLTGAWNKEVWAGYPDGHWRKFWQAGPLRVTQSK